MLKLQCVISAALAPPNGIFLFYMTSLYVCPTNRRRPIPPSAVASGAEMTT